MLSNFFHGSKILVGSNTTPGIPTPKYLQDLFIKTLDACSKFGLDFYDTIIHLLPYDEISEIAAYGGFPVRYPHWRFGMEYEQLQRGYEHNMQRIFEMVINCDPCHMYCLASNTDIDNITVVAHATGHNDFFKNNIHFAPTSRNMMTKMANHGYRIRKYMDRWGYERVTEFIDHVLRVHTLIDPTKARNKREFKAPVIRDSREYQFPNRLPVSHNYMEQWINTPEYIEKEKERIRREDAAKDLEILEYPEKDILGFLMLNAPLKPWQSDIVSMLYDEAIYYAPQRATKVANEGFASFIDYEIMARQGFASLGYKKDENGIIQYAKHKAAVLGSKYSMNPYKLGFSILLDVEDRWNKGRFGTEWEECKDIRKKENWDTKAMLGKEKVLEVRKYYDDVTMLNEFFTQEFCDKYEFFEWKKYPNGEYKIENRDAKKIKEKLVKKHTNGGLPDIRLVDYNHKNQGNLFLEHVWDGRVLYESYVRETLSSIHYLWNRDVLLATKTDSEEDVVFLCVGQNPDKDIMVLTKYEYQRK